VAKASRPAPGIDTSVPNIARVYDYWLPWLARQNREFLRRAVCFLASEGITQFLDIGSGLPANQNVHEVAQQVNPDARVVYEHRVHADPRRGGQEGLIEIGVHGAAHGRGHSALWTNAVSEYIGISRATRRTSSPGSRTAALGSMTPATVSTAPASPSMARQRVRMVRATRIRPMTVSSEPVRAHRRIRLVRATRVNLGAPYRSADELHTTRFRRCDRSLIPASRTTAPRCVYSMLGG
jgi:hypothetical protein